MASKFFKSLLGETRSERKRRLLCDGVIVLLVILGGFYWHVRRIESLVLDANVEGARMLVHPVLRDIHWDAFGENREPLDLLSGEDKPAHFHSYWISLQKKNPKHELNATETEALKTFAQAASREKARVKAGGSPAAGGKFSDGSDKYITEVTADGKTHRSIHAVLFRPACLTGCHTVQPSADNPRQSVLVENGDLAAAVVIELPIKQANR